MQLFSMALMLIQIIVILLLNFLHGFSACILYTLGHVRLDPEHAAESQGKPSVSVYESVCNSS